MGELIQTMADGLQWVSEREEGGVVQPVRSVVRVDKYCGLGAQRAMTSSLFPCTLQEPGADASLLE